MAETKRHKNANGTGTYTFMEKRNAWRYRVSIDGTRKDFYGTTKTAAFNKYKEYSKENVDVSKDVNIALGKAVTSWVKKRKVSLRSASYDNLLYIVNNCICEYIGHYDIKDITTDVIQEELINKMLSNGVARGTIGKTRTYLNQFFKWYIENSETRIKKNPVTNTIVPSKEKFLTSTARSSRYTTEDGEVIICTKEEVQAIADVVNLKYASGKRVLRYGLAYMLILETGLRRAELLGLTMDCIHLEGKNKYIEVKNTTNIVNIRDNKDQIIKTETILQPLTKTDSSRRIIPLNDQAQNIIKLLIEEMQRDDSNHIIHDHVNTLIYTEKGTLMTPRNFNRGFHLLCDRAKITRRGVHALRHTFATDLINHGVDVKTVQKLLGHASVETTYNIYVHVINANKEKAVEAINLDRPSIE